VEASARAAARHVEAWLADHADPAAVPPMAAYMKLEARADPIAFCGVRKTQLAPLVRELKVRF